MDSINTCKESSTWKYLEGFCGDCGNWAMAFQRKFGGQLVYFGDDYSHVAVRLNEFIYDAMGKWTQQEFEEYYNNEWMYHGGNLKLKNTSKKKIYKNLTDYSNEDRVLELMNWIEIPTILNYAYGFGY